MSEIYGHKENLEFLNSMIEKGRFPHTILFYGLMGIGKKKIALELAKMLNCKGNTSSEVKDENDGGMFSMFGDAEMAAPAAPVETTDTANAISDDKKKQLPCNACESCIKIDKGMHPDIFMVEPENEMHKIDTFRDIKNNCNLSPIEGKYRVTIIDDAHFMNVNAANSVLKLLEEPPANNVFVLITHDRGSLLKTINSRCFPLRFAPPTVAETEKILETLGLEKNYLITTRSPGLIALSSNEELNQKRKIIVTALLNFLDKKINVETATSLFDSFMDEQAIGYVGYTIDILISSIRDIALLSSLNSRSNQTSNTNIEVEIYNKDFENEFTKIAQTNIPIYKYNKAMTNLIDLKSIMTNNLNKKLFATNTINTLIGIVYG